jgi:hypothetical protein
LRRPSLASAPAVATVDEEPARTVEVVQLGQVSPVGVEDLNPMVLAVGHVDEPLGVGRDVVRQVEAAGIGPRLPPGEEVPATGIVLVDARVPVAVGDVEVARDRRERDVGGPVERLAALEPCRRVRVPEGQQELPLPGELPDRVVAVVGQPDQVVGADGDRMGPADEPLAPGAEEVALPVKDHQGVVATVE